jgi:predicted transcriptional regulator of viral defense system
MAELRRLGSAIANPDATVRMSEVARRQWGAISSAQLRSCGLRKSTISRWVQQARLHRLQPGVYAVGHAALPIEGRLVAALLYAGRGAVLSHATAAWWWGLISDEPETIDVSVGSVRPSV